MHVGHAWFTQVGHAGLKQQPTTAQLPLNCTTIQHPCAHTTHPVPCVQLHPRLLHQLSHGGVVPLRGNVQPGIALLQVMWAERYIASVRLLGRLAADVSSGRWPWRTAVDRQ